MMTKIANGLLYLALTGAAVLATIGTGATLLLVLAVAASETPDTHASSPRFRQIASECAKRHRVVHDEIGRLIKCGLEGE